MKKLEVNYYVTKDETVVFAVPKENWAVVARFVKGEKEWTLVPTINEMVLTHEDDYYPYGEYGALLITGGIYPDKVLTQSLHGLKELGRRCKKIGEETERILKDYEERFKDK